MGYYINDLPAKGKAEALIAKGAVKTTATFKPNLVCVVENGPFDAAAYCHSEQEFEAFSDFNDDRPKHWLIVENADILSGFAKESLYKQ